MTLTNLPVLKFSRDWTKLQDRVFTTIRKSHPPYEGPEGESWSVQTPTKTFTAKLLLNTNTSIDDLSDSLLMYDTDSPTREEALQKINSFYRDPPHYVQLMLFQRLESWRPLRLDG